MSFLCAIYGTYRGFAISIGLLANTLRQKKMLLPDTIYRHIPILWLLMGFFLVFYSLVAWPNELRFAAYLFLGLGSIARSIWLFQARKRVVRHAEVTVLTATQKIDRLTAKHS